MLRIIAPRAPHFSYNETLSVENYVYAQNRLTLLLSGTSRVDGVSTYIANLRAIQMSESLSPRASEYLESIAKWFTTAKVEAVNQNSSRCIDEDRFEVLKPLWEELNLEKEVFYHPLLNKAQLAYAS